VRKLYPARVFDVLHHQVAQGLQVERGITGHQGHATTGNATGRDQWVERAGFARALGGGNAAVEHVDAAHAGAAQLHIAAQVDQHTITMVRSRGHAGRVQRPTDAHAQIAAAGQLLAAIAGDPARAADRQGQALTVGVYSGVVEAIAQGIQDPGITDHVHVQIAATQGAETGEAKHFVRRRGRGVTAEIDPPGGGLSLPARGHVTTALAPQPVADCGRVHSGVLGVGTRIAGRSAGDITGQVTADIQGQIAPSLRVPGPVAAGG